MFGFCSVEKGRMFLGKVGDGPLSSSRLKEKGSRAKEKINP